MREGRGRSLLQHNHLHSGPTLALHTKHLSPALELVSDLWQLLFAVLVHCALSPVHMVDSVDPAELQSVSHCTSVVLWEPVCVCVRVGGGLSLKDQGRGQTRKPDLV